MQQHIPDDLGQEVARLAAGMDLPLEVVVREALENWVGQQRRKMGRVPDEPLMDDMLVVPGDLPRNAPHAIEVISGARRVPDVVGLE